MNSLRRDPATVARARGRQRSPGHAFVGAGVVLLAASCLVAGCTSPGDGGPRDVGNMAYPTPLPQGTVATTSTFRRAGPDTGSMAYPDPLPQGAIGRTTARPQGFDTGNMAYPTPLPQEAVATTITR